MPNERPAVDAGMALWFHVVHHWPGTTEAESSALARGETERANPELEQQRVPTPRGLLHDKTLSGFLNQASLASAATRISGWFRVARLVVLRELELFIPIDSLLNWFSHESTQSSD
jgi:hypothetical protein